MRSLTMFAGLLLCLFATANSLKTPAHADEPTGELATRLAGVKFDHYSAAPG